MQSRHSKSILYKRVGFTVQKMYPGVCAGIIRLVNQEPVFTDMTLIPALYKQFKNITTSQSKDVYRKLVFIAVIVKLYDPVYFSEINFFFLKTGLSMYLKKEFKCSRASISKSLPVIKLHLNVYDEFRYDVEIAYHKLKSKISESVP